MAVVVVRDPLLQCQKLLSRNITWKPRVVRSLFSVPSAGLEYKSSDLGTLKGGVSIPAPQEVLMAVKQGLYFSVPWPLNMKWSTVSRFLGSSIFLWYTGLIEVVTFHT